jgi:hypothetical protein
VTRAAAETLAPPALLSFIPPSPTPEDAAGSGHVADGDGGELPLVSVGVLCYVCASPSPVGAWPTGLAAGSSGGGDLSVVESGGGVLEHGGFVLKSAKAVVFGQTGALRCHRQCCLGLPSGVVYRHALYRSGRVRSTAAREATSGPQIW